MFLSKVEVIGLGDLISCACDSDRTRRNWKAHVVLWFDMRKLQQSRQRQKGPFQSFSTVFILLFLSFFHLSLDWSFGSLSGLFLGPLLQSTDREARNLQYRLLAAADSVCYFVSQRDGMMAHLCIVWVRLRKVLKLQRRRRRSFWKKKTRFRFDKDAVPGHQARSPGKPERDWPATVRGHLVIWRWCDCYILK